MQVSKHGLRALATKDNNPSAGQDRRVPISRRRGRSRDPRLDPARRVHIQHMRVIQVREARLLAFVEMPPENDQRGACQGGGVATAGRRGHTLDLGKRPEPLALNYTIKKNRCRELGSYISAFFGEFCCCLKTLSLSTYLLLPACPIAERLPVGRRHTSFIGRRPCFVAASFVITDPCTSVIAGRPSTSFFSFKSVLFSCSLFGD